MQDQATEFYRLHPDKQVALASIFNERAKAQKPVQPKRTYGVQSKAAEDAPAPGSLIENLAFNLRDRHLQRIQGG